jgi:hypothetical protein
MATLYGLSSIGVLNILNIRNMHAIIRSEPVMLPIRINVLMMNYRRWLMPIYTEAYPLIDITIPVKGQLLDYAEAVQVTEDTDVYGIPFLGDMKCSVMRVSFMNDSFITGDEDGVLAPYVRDGTLCLCWRLILPLVIIYPLREGDIVRDIPVHIVNGTGLAVSSSVRVFRACGYGELLSALGAFFSQVGLSPWAELALELDEDLKRFYRDAFKIYLCPASLRQEQLDAVGAIIADNDTGVGHVFHEFIGYDWFEDRPLPCPG